MYYPEWNLSNILLSVVLTTVSCSLVYREMNSLTRLKYSKFSSGIPQRKTETMIPSFYGMLLIYSPSMFVCFFLALNSFTDKRLFCISVLLTLHYVKRVMEVLFVHKYSGSSKLVDNCIISISYATFSVLVYSFSMQVNNSKTPTMVIGALLFIFGELFNFYHHYLLSRLRQGTCKEYKIPSEGFFKYSWCPHYVGEIISFLAIVLITQHFHILLLQMGSSAYLVVRAYNTKEWYKKKFNQVPDRACLLPFVF